MGVNNYPKSVQTGKGRELHVIEAGQPDGIPILVQHGTPGPACLCDAWVADAQRRGIRLISYDRPGYGGSTRHRDRKVASAADDVKAIAKQCNLEQLLVFGYSGGGPHALACAALLPDLVVAAAAVASLAPYESFLAAGLDWFAGMCDTNAKEFRIALQGRDALQAYFEPFTTSGVFVEFAAPWLNNAQGKDGEVDDDRALIMSWGFEVSQIKIPVMIMHGDKDENAPYSHGLWLARTIPGAELKTVANTDHRGTAYHVPEVHEWLLRKSCKRSIGDPEDSH